MVLGGAAQRRSWQQAAWLPARPKEGRSTRGGARALEPSAASSRGRHMPLQPPLIRPGQAGPLPGGQEACLAHEAALGEGDAVEPVQVELQGVHLAGRGGGGVGGWQLDSEGQGNLQAARLLPLTGMARQGQYVRSQPGTQRQPNASPAVGAGLPLASQPKPAALALACGHGQALLGSPTPPAHPRVSRCLPQPRPA